MITAYHPPLFILALVASSLQGAVTTFSNLNVIATYPTSVISQAGISSTFTVGVQAAAGSTDNVAGLTCTGSKLSISVNPQFISIAPGMMNIFTGTIDPASSGSYSFTCSLLSGIRNGADHPAVTLGPISNMQRLPTKAQVPETMATACPVSEATGELFEPYSSDLYLGGPMRLSFRRYYASLLVSNGITSKMGNNWMHNFDYSITFTPGRATVIMFGGKTVTFQASGTLWQLSKPDMMGYQLAAVASGGYQFLDPASNLIYTFTSSGTLTKIEDRNGNAVTLAVQANGSTVISDGLGRTLTLSVDASGFINRVQDQSGRFASFAHTGSDLTQVTDANGKIRKFSYTTASDLTGLMTSHTFPAGNAPLVQGWSSSGQVSKQTDSLGFITSFVFDPSGQGATTVTNQQGNNNQFVHSNFSRLTSYTDPYSNAASMSYDSNGRRTSITDRLGDKSSRTYHVPSGYLASYTDTLGNTTSYTYAQQTQGAFTFYVLTSIQYADGSTIAFTNDPAGNRITITDQAGKTTKYTYNSRGQILTMTTPLGGTVTNTYNPDATVVTTVDASGNTRTHSYDDKKRLQQVKYADGTTVSLAYDNLDNIVKQTDERGKSQTAVFNDNNHLQSTSNRMGNTASAKFDSNDRLTSRSDYLGKFTNFDYNEAGLLKRQTEPAGDFYSLTYDKLLRPVSRLDANGKGHTYAYDKEDVMASFTDAMSRTWTFGTDKMGRTTSTTTPLGQVYTTVYDKRGRVTAETDPAGMQTSYSYDARGSLASVRIGGPASGGQSVAASYIHNDTGGITAATDPNGQTWTQNFDSAGRFVSRTDPLGQSSLYSFDQRNRTSGWQSLAGTAAYTFDAGGNKLRELYSDGTDLNFTYDDEGRLLTAAGLTLARDANGQITASNGIAIARDVNSRIASITYGDGKSVLYSYDTRGLLTGVKDWVGGTTAFQYNDAHQVVSLTRPDGTTTQYSYDKNGKLASIVESAGATINLTRDAAGRVDSSDRNLPQQTVPAPGSFSSTFDAASQIAGATYDALGRLTTDTMRTYTWDLASRLSSYSGADGAATSTYDGLGMRTSTTTGQGTQNFILNYALALPSIATVQDGSGNDQRYYVQAPDGALLYSIEAADNTRHFFHYDETGSTTFLTDDTGAITDSYGITPYGESVTLGPGNSTVNPFTWMGQFGVMQEGTTSMYYMRARFYDSANGRFLSRDPAVSFDPMAMNPYPYAIGNPIGYNDPTGLDPNPYDQLRPFYQVSGPHSDWATPPNRGSKFFWLSDPLAPIEIGTFDLVVIPDYMTLSGGFPLCAGCGGHVDFTLDRYGNTYVTVGPSFGVGLDTMGGSLTGNWLLQSSRSEADLKGFLTGWGGSFGGSWDGPEAQVSYSPWANDGCTKWSGGVGMGTPGAALSIGYSWNIQDLLKGNSGAMPSPSPKPVPAPVPAQPQPQTQPVSEPGLIDRGINALKGFIYNTIFGGN